MRLISPIRKISFLFFVILIWAIVPGNLYAQDTTSSTYKVNSKYHHEYNPYFKFGKLIRGLSSDSLKLTLDTLENKPRNTWSRLDSLEFASASLNTGNRELSRYYFDHLNVSYNKESKFWYDHLMIYMLGSEFDEGISYIEQTGADTARLTKLYFFRKIFEAKKKEAEDPKWHKSHNVLNWHVDSTLFDIDKESEEFQQKIIKPLENLDFVLKIIIHHIHENDPILSMVCFEMGQILEFHISYTQAYIAYSLGRHYNKWDKELLEEIKQIKSKMMERNYKIPIFRKHFPRIEKWRFEYEVLKEKVISQRSDTLTKEKPKIVQPVEEEPLIGFPPQLISIAGLLLMFILLLIFLKPKKRR